MLKTFQKIFQEVAKSLKVKDLYTIIQKILTSLLFPYHDEKTRDLFFKIFVKFFEDLQSVKIESL